VLRIRVQLGHEVDALRFFDGQAQYPLPFPVRAHETMGCVVERNHHRNVVEEGLKYLVLLPLCDLHLVALDGQREDVRDGLEEIDIVGAEGPWLRRVHAERAPWPGSTADDHAHRAQDPVLEHEG